MLTELPLPPIAAILAFFGLGSPRSIAPTALGMANHSYLVTTEAGETYVVKQLIHQQARLLPNDLAVQQQLHSHGIGAPHYIQSPSGGYLYEQAGVSAVVAARIAGVHPPALTPRLAHPMGSVLARYHQAVHSLPLAHAGWLNRRTAGPPGATNQHSSLSEAALALLHAGGAIFEAPLPHGIIHGDFHIGNLLMRSRTDPTIAAVLDFEEAQRSPLLVDVAFGLFGSYSLHCTRRRTQANLHAFLDGYEAVRPLQAEEKDNLASAVRFVAGACALWLYERGYVDNAAHNLAVATALQQIDLTR